MKSDSREFSASFSRLAWYGLMITGFVALVMAGLRDIVDADIFFHIRFGQKIIADRAVSFLDTFSFTNAGRPWVDQSWLVDTIYAWLYDIFGLPAMVWLKAILYATSFSIVLFQTTKKWQECWHSLLLILITFIYVSPRVIDRPENWGLLYLAVSLVTLSRARSYDDRLLYLLPLIQILWVNSHASCVLGPLLVMIAFVTFTMEDRLSGGRYHLRRTHLMVICLLMCLASLVNPWGVHYAAYLWSFRNTDLLAAWTSEWLPSNLFSISERPWEKITFWLLLALSALAILRRSFQKRPVFFECGVLCLFSILAFQAARHRVFFAVAALFVIQSAAVESVQRLSGARHGHRLHLLGANIALTATAFFCWSLPTGALFRLLDLPVRFGVGIASEYVPNRAVDFLKQNGLENKRLFNSYDFGGYLILSGISVFIDGRVTDYDPAFLAEVLQLRRGNPETLRKFTELWDLKVMLLSISLDIGLIEELKSHADWTPIYFDSNAIIFARRTPDMAQVIQEFDWNQAQRRESLIKNASFYWPEGTNPDLTKIGGFPSEQWFLGRFYQIFGLYAQAEAELRRGVSIAPRSEELYRELVITLMATGQNAKAIDAILAILPAIKPNADVHRTLGYLYSSLGNAPSAIQHLMTSLSMEPTPTRETLRILALLYHSQGETKAAETYSAMYLSSGVSLQDAETFRALFLPQQAVISPTTP